VWIPDVYQGAPTPVTAFLSTGSKTAGVVLLVRMTESVFLPSVSVPGGLPWDTILGIVAAATLLFGVLGAMAQRSIKRMLGYSSIAHAGYLLMGVAAASAGGVEAARSAGSAILFYLMAFVLTNLTLFAGIVLVGAATGSAGRHESPTYAGLARRSPFVAAAMLLALLSLAGVPPLSGFFGKFLILKSVVDVATAHGSAGFFALAFVGAAGVVVSLYFYLAWIARMYFRSPEPEGGEAPVRVGPWAGAVLILGIAAMLGMGVFMGPFYEWATDAAASLVAAR
jgi:NADH-quinone oxidoreductase subunit N